jgi:dGTPase
MGALYTAGDRNRVLSRNDDDGERYRSPWRKDYARLIHSPSFRRLQGKTQVFPGQESDFFGNRLTHSLEVAQIAKSIAIRLNARSRYFKGKNFPLIPEIVELAGLAHDLGHPPFGHTGEEALDECMRDYGGFEGNAQTLRIVGRLEKKTTFRSVGNDMLPFDGDQDLRCGLNLTYRSLASLIKYDSEIPEKNSERKNQNVVMKGYYKEENTLIQLVKYNVLGQNYADAEHFKTVECSIIDVADDIAYSTYDLEDNFKAGFLSPAHLFALDDNIYEAAAQTIRERIEEYYPEKRAAIGYINKSTLLIILMNVFDNSLFGVGDDNLLRSRNISSSGKEMLISSSVQKISNKLSKNGYQRTKFTSGLVHSFISAIEVVPNRRFSQLHRVRLKFFQFLVVEVLKNITFHAIINSSVMQVVQYRGREMVKRIFHALNKSDGAQLLPDDFRWLCENSST